MSSSIFSCTAQSVMNIDQMRQEKPMSRSHVNKCAMNSMMVLLILFLTSATLSAEEPARTDQYKPMPMPTNSGQPDRSGQGIITPGEILTLDKCIDIALKKSPIILAAISTVDVSQSRVGEARSAYYPQLSATGTFDRIAPVPGTSAAPFGVRPRFNQYTSTVALNQTIYDFGKTSSSVDVSKYNLESSRFDLNGVQDTITLSVKQAYYGVLSAKRNRDVAADVIKQYQLHLEQAKGFYDVGTKAKIDVIKAEVDLSNAQLSLINAENALKISWVTLNTTMGVPDAPEYEIEDNLSFHQYAVTLEDATERAFENRPDLLSIIAKRQAAEASINFAKSGYYPVLSGSASYNSSAVDIPPSSLTQGGLDHGWDVGIALTIPIFSGFLTSHQVAEAKSSLYVLRANEESIRNQILLDVRQSFLNLQAAEASISTSELAASQAKENLDLANGRYAAGVGSPIEVSDAFATYVSAQATYTGALYNYKLAQANIERAMGVR
jgi:outer membrane protein